MGKKVKADTHKSIQNTITTSKQDNDILARFAAEELSDDDLVRQAEVYMQDRIAAENASLDRLYQLIRKEKKPNPLYCWQALHACGNIQKCRDYLARSGNHEARIFAFSNQDKASKIGMEMPRWLYDYIQECAIGFMLLTSNINPTESEPVKGFPSLMRPKEIKSKIDNSYIPAAMGFKRQGKSFFDDFRIQGQKSKLAKDVVKKTQELGSQSKAIQALGKDDRSTRRIIQKQRAIERLVGPKDPRPVDE